MSIKHEKKHFPLLIFIIFIANFLAGIIGGMFPALSISQTFFWQLGSLFYVTGCALLSLKLAEEKWNISASGFIMLSIGQGIFYTLQSAAINEELYRAFATGILLLMPGYFFVCYYSGFPVWLRGLGVVSTIPFLIIEVKYYQGTYDFYKDAYLNGIGFGLQQLTGIGWGYFSIRPLKLKG